LHEQTPPRLPRHTRPCHSQTQPAPASQRGAVAPTPVMQKIWQLYLLYHFLAELFNVEKYRDLEI